jgi:predicted ATPase/DNA-binding SARP family transcriptional activator
LSHPGLALLCAVVAGGLSFGVLGPLSVRRDGVELPLGSPRQRTLLALLLRAGGSRLSRDQLINELWGDDPPASARAALHVHLSKLRALIDDPLVPVGGGYRLDPDNHELDARQLDELVEAAQADPSRASAVLREALELFRGDPLCDIDSDGSLIDWRRELEERRLLAMSLRIDADLARGAAADMVGELESLVSAHPFDERFWSQLMLALHRSGRRADALDAYRRVRRVFVDELGLEPGEPLRCLHERMIAGDPALDARGLAPRGTTEALPQRARSDLPRSPTRLVGRDRDLELLVATMADPDRRLLTLTGAGGVGKTRLMLELGCLREGSYRDGAVFVRLERLTDPALVTAEIASALARRDRSNAPNADGPGSYLRDKQLLLLLDNFEHVIDAATVVAELIEVAPGVQVLISSRTAIRIRGETRFAVAPLALPAAESDMAVAQSPAVQLFVQCAQAADHRLELDGPALREVARICGALDGLPLAIELVAARADVVPLAEIAEQLRASLPTSDYALRDLPARQQTLEATIRWSYDLLSSPQRDALQAAGVFLGGFASASLEAVLGRPAAVLIHELIDASLMRPQGQEDRGELLELVRAFALAELTNDGHLDELRARHRHHFAAIAMTVSEAFTAGGSPSELAGPLLPDHANLRAALEDAIGADDDRSAVALALGLRPVWLAGLLRDEGQDLIARVLDRFATTDAQEILLLQAAAFLDYSPEFKSWYRRLAARATELQRYDALATAIGSLFGKALNSRDLAEMRRLRPELQAMIRPETGKALGWIHYYLALDAYVDGRIDAACEHASLCAANAETIGHQFMLATGAGTRLLCESTRDGTLTQPALTATLELMRRPGVPPVSANALWFVARYAASIAPGTAPYWLAHADRILAEHNTVLWPESVLRDETLSLLGIHELPPDQANTPAVAHDQVLSEAIDWIVARDPTESAPRHPTATGHLSP